jgi:hypothetical protein
MDSKPMGPVSDEWVAGDIFNGYMGDVAPEKPHP